ncbi:MAG: hypothetical protein ACOCWI_03180 [Bacillota bacterium]
MKKLGLIIALILLLCLGLTACDEGKDILEAKTIEITSPSDLKDIRNYLGEKYSRYTFELQNDIDLSGEPWEPIGYDNDNSFRATFSANGYSVKNLTIAGASGTDFIKKINYSNVGLFGYIYDATITELNLEDINIRFFAEKTYMHIGGVAGYAYGDNTLEDISVTGNIKVGTTFELIEKESDLLENCDQTHYIGGALGYSSGKLLADDIGLDVSINNLIGSRGPQQERDIHGEYTGETYISVITDNAEPNFFPKQTFAGGLAGLIKGKDSMLSNISSSVNIPLAYGNSTYCGGIAGAVYQSHITNSIFDGHIGAKVYIKGVLGGLAGLVDEAAIINSTVEDAEIELQVTKQEYEAYSAGGLAGYINDFSSIASSQVTNTKVISNIPNIIFGTEYDYPSIGGLAGTLKDSSIYGCTADGGGVYMNQTTKADDNYISSAGMVAEVFGNSELANCETSFYAYNGVVASYSETIYVDDEGKRVLRYIKDGYPDVYVDIRAYTVQDVLYVDLINNAQEVIETYTYNNFTPNGIENYSQYYYSRAMGGEGSLVDEQGKVIVVDGRMFEDYELLTGRYSFSELSYFYYEDTAMVEGEDDIENSQNPDWKIFVPEEIDE